MRRDRALFPSIKYDFFQRLISMGPWDPGDVIGTTCRTDGSGHAP
jgi:hypothetical protein